jgi:hypothetical protein
LYGCLSKFVTRTPTNIGRRHLPAEEKRKLNRIWKIFSLETTRRGHPTKKEIELREALLTKGILELPELDRHLIRLYGLHKEKV